MSFLFATLLNTMLWNTRFFKKQHFYKQPQAEIDKKLSHTLRANFCYLKIIHIFHPCYDPKIIGQVTSVQKKQKNQWACIHDIIRLIIMKMKVKMKNRLHRYNISMMMFICIKQHLSNSWSSIHEKVKQHLGWVEKKCCLQNKSGYII